MPIYAVGANQPGGPISPLSQVLRSLTEKAEDVVQYIKDSYFDRIHQAGSDIKHGSFSSSIYNGLKEDFSGSMGYAKGPFYSGLTPVFADSSSNFPNTHNYSNIDQFRKYL